MHKSDTEPPVAECIPDADSEDVVAVGLAEYWSMEENNRRASIQEMGKELELVRQLDQLFSAAIHAGDLAGVIRGYMFRFAHSRFLFAFSTMARCHESEAWSSARRAIDATLVAYCLTVRPEDTETYLRGSGHFDSVKGHVKKHRERYPLAARLLVLHGLASKHGSHADWESIKAHIEHPDDSALRFGFNYFDVFDHNASRRLAVTQLSQIFAEILCLFAQSNAVCAENDQDWVSQALAIRSACDRWRKELTASVEQLVARPPATPTARTSRVGEGEVPE